MHRSDQEPFYVQGERARRKRDLTKTSNSKLRRNSEEGKLTQAQKTIKSPNQETKKEIFPSEIAESKTQNRVYGLLNY